MNEVFPELEPPKFLAKRSSAREIFERARREKLELDELELKKLTKIIEVLQHPELDALIDEGKISLGMIKPNVNLGRGLPSGDDEAAERIIAEIGEERVIFSISVLLTQEEVAEFYAPNKDRFQKMPAPDNPSKTLWESILDCVSSGPVTFMLIYDKSGNAIQAWRKTMGATTPSQADPDSLRGRFGDDSLLPNNLLHGSDSMDEVKRELALLANVLSDLQRKLSPDL